MPAHPLFQDDPASASPPAGRPEDAYDLARSLMRAGEAAAFLEQAPALRASLVQAGATKARIAEFLLLEAEALFLGGRASEARQALAAHEKTRGPSFLSRRLAARMHLNFGEFEACVRACDAAILAIPASDGVSLHFDRLVRLRNDALCRLGRRAEARAFLVESLKDRPWGSSDMEALRETVDGAADLPVLFQRLAPDFHRSDPRGLAALYHYSVACRDAGRMEPALAAARQRFLNGIGVAAFGGKPKAEKPRFAADATRALHDLADEMGRAGARFFLVSGTFLGCVREGAILSHDKDIDVGIYAGLRTPWLRRRLARSGRFDLRRSGCDRLIRLRHANGVAIDLFVHWTQGGRTYHEGRTARWSNTAFALAPYDFLGGRFLGPKNADRYLTENYGDWRRPDADFEASTDTPNLVRDRDPERLLWYYYLKLYDLYAAGRAAPLAKVAAAVRALRPNDAVLARALRKAEAG